MEKENIEINGVTLMDIESKKGTKVRFIAKNPESWGIGSDNAKHLVFGKIYTVDHTDIHSWHTEVYLEEIPGIAFGSTWFEEIK